MSKIQQQYTKLRKQLTQEWIKKCKSLFISMPFRRRNLWKNIIFEQNKNLIKEYPKKQYMGTLINQERCASAKYILKDVQRTFEFTGVSPA